MLRVSLLLLCLLGACAVRMQSPIKKRYNYARDLRPADLEAGQGARRAALRVLELHVYTDADYRAQNPGWRGKFNDLIEHTNGVLASALGAELHVTKVEDWQPSASASDLDACLGELRGLDRGASNTWVLGLVGALPQLTSSFEELARASDAGSHMVMHGLSEEAEREAIEVLHRLSGTQRRDLFRQRLEHKAAVVLLHALAHTLGGLHELDKDTFMHAYYNDEQSAFAPATVELLRTMLDARLAGESDRMQADKYRALLERDTGTWDPQQRARTLADLDQRFEPTALRMPTQDGQVPSLAALAGASAAQP